MAAEHTAHASWKGDLMSGSGSVSTGSGAVSGVPLTWKARAEDASAGSSPEELIAAALAACFSMALSHGLAQGGNPPTSIETDATAAFDRTDAGFREAAEAAKANCPVSKALEGNVEITLDSALG